MPLEPVASELDAAHNLSREGPAHPVPIPPLGRERTDEDRLDLEVEVSLTRFEGGRYAVRAGYRFSAPVKRGSEDHALAEYVRNFAISHHDMLHRAFLAAMNAQKRGEQA